MNLYEEAAKCLYKIASRKCAKSIETPIVVSLFRDVPMRQILTAANAAAADSSTSCEHYKYLKALLDLLCALGIHLSEVWTYVMKPPPNFSLYISALSAFFVHPSIYIRAETAQVIATFCSNEKISANEDFLNYTPQLLKILPRAMSKTCSPTIGQEDLTFQYSRMDYENKDDMQREYLRLRDYCLRIIRETLPNHFDKLFVVVNDWVMNRCVVNPQQVNSDEWDLMKRFLTAVISGSYQNELLTTLTIRRKYLELFDSIFQCCLNILNSSLSLPIFMNGLLSTLSSFFQIFENFSERILNVLDLLKLILMVNNQNNVDIEITATKRHCIALLLKIVSQFSEQVKPFARNVFDLVSQVSNNVSMMQRANLVHVLASLSNLASSVEEKTNFLRNAIQFDINYIENEPFSSSMENFLNNTGLSFAPDLKAVANQSCPYYLSRLNLKASLTALEGVLNQVEVPCDEQSSANIFNLFFTVLPKFFRFCRCLTAIYMPEYSSKINPIYGLSILEMVPSERQTLVSSIALEPETNGADLKKFDEFEVGQFSNGYGSQEVSMSRIITSCPPQYSNTIIPLVTRLAFHLQKRLVEQWSLIKQTQTIDEYEPNEEELIAESTMSLLTRECSYFIVNFILGESFSLKNARKDVPLPITLISRKLMENENARLNIIGLLAKLITCPDSQAVVKCLPAVTVIVHEYFSTFNEQISVDLLVHSIRSLQMFCNDELATGPILILIYDVYSYLRPKYPALLEVIRQVPTCLPENISAFDQRIMSMVEPEDAKNTDKIKKDLIRKVLTSTKSRLQYRKASSETNGDEELKEME
uniref:Exportin-7 n=1 Tax=Meloidogyne hapla TaxID=6305 RepID=A0A1I8BWV0_MELHA